jgi:hypothetical protein
MTDVEGKGGAAGRLMCNWWCYATWVSRIIADVARVV